MGHTGTRYLFRAARYEGIRPMITLSPSLPPAETQQIRELLALIADPVAAKERLEALSAETNALQQTFKHAKAVERELAEREARVAAREQALDERMAALDVREAAIRAREATVAETLADLRRGLAA